MECSDCRAENGSITATFETLEPGVGGEETFDITIEDNPSRLWLTTACPPAVDPLGEAMQVRLSFVRDGADEQLFPDSGDTGSLDELGAAFSDGIRLDDRLGEPCLSPGDDLSLQLEYELPSTADWTANLTTALSLQLFAEQCRGVSDADRSSPPATATDCPDLECPDCTKLGKVDVVGDRLEPRSYAFDELYGAFENTSDEYRLEVLRVTNKRDDSETETVCASVRILENGAERDAPPICRVTVGGGRPMRPPNDPDSRVAAYDVDPPLTRTRREVCAAHGEAKTDPDSVEDGERPGISNITVYVCADEEGGDSS
ncbi:hypothetical protein D8Y22_07140 [Salinadaptatus halalkaliphilus]|uniref:Uncharacterized protein n=1 Tax=Salinadaptatus halalkaliphilus TaxID=2419781 RepID=A0A4S3TMX0_9EURY|nr:hypothetical protein D8Y22_07140 [Salinadaptatus halalkaliphilus]